VHALQVFLVIKPDNGLDFDFLHDFGFLHRKHVITDGLRAGIQVVPGRQQNVQHLVWNHMHYKGCVMVAGKPHVRSTRGTKWKSLDGTWTMTGTKCAAIKRLVLVMSSDSKTEIINRIKTLDLTN